ncbi:MAG TPA: ABC transporter permease, partial [Gemmatimonadaceae bacterium]
MRNLKLAFRTLFKTPFVTSVAIISLALGIGANAAIFSLFDEMLLRPLPVSHPDQLVSLKNPGPKPGSQSCNQAGDCDEVFSYAMFRDLERARTPVALAAHRLFSANVAYDGQTLNGEGTLVSGSYFPILGLQPELGRLFTPEDDKTIGANYAAVLSYGYWETRLGADRRVVGKAILVNGKMFTIIGVAPRDFTGTTAGSRPMLFLPLTMRSVVQPGAGPISRTLENRRNYFLYLFGRLRPGVSLQQATAALNAAYHPIVTDVEAPLQQGMSAQTMARFRAKSIVVEDGRRGQSSIHQQARTPLTLLLSITGIVLLIACANVANLLLARGASRSLEMAVRLSLGATRRQLLAQLLTESVVLAALGGMVSVLIAHWTLGAFRALLPSDAAQTLDISLRGSVLAFTAALSLGTGLLFGLFPALHSTRSDLVTSIRSNAGQISGARAASRFRSSLVTAQIALSMALLMSAGLFIKSLRNVSRVDLGIKPDGVVTFAVSPRLNGYDSTRSQVLFGRMEEELAALPGVNGVTSSLVPILTGDNWGNDVGVEGFKKGPDIDNNSRFNEVGPNYFRVMGVPVLSGREFTASDVLGSPKVAMVNEAFAKKFGLGRNAVGKRMDQGNDSLDIEIVGLVKDAKYSQVKDSVPALFFRPYKQDANPGFLTFYVRSAIPGQTLRAVPPLVAKLDRNLPVENLKTLPQ